MQLEAKWLKAPNDTSAPLLDVHYMLHAFTLRTFSRPPRATHLPRISIRLYGFEPYGLLPRHVVEKARQALPPSAIPVRPAQASSSEETSSQEGEVSQRQSGLDEDERVAAKRRRRTEWKRRQGVSAYTWLTAFRIRATKLDIILTCTYS